MALRNAAESSGGGVSQRWSARPEVLFAAVHPFGVQRDAAISPGSGNQQAMVLHEEDRRREPCASR